MNKGLEALERLKNTLLAEGYWQDVLEDFAIIETALNKYCQSLKEEETTKKIKALEIIKEKQVDVSALLELDNLQHYNRFCTIVGGCKRLTQEEYDLLKEVLNEIH